ncbi:hypothetical protein WT11_01075 [Burkholderia stagnalis]|uniref:hypothetical protein n=1 Tax=Burkholderia stagnalis TaxID=1503054 RepID=UPI0007529A92|nr:hypothetical protein [Burkholderia stagnalis]KVN31717.1 hypothetical protein WT11_01075 [Burkholderia stagnalis]
MDAGFWCRTDDNATYQIDGYTPIFGLKEHLLLTLQNRTIPLAGGAMSVQYVTVPYAAFSFSANQPVVAFRSESCPAQMLACRNTGGSGWLAEFWGLANGASVEMFVFDRLSSFTGGSSFGMKVWNPSGELVADAVTPQMLPVGFLTGNMSADVGGGWPGPGWQQGLNNPGHGWTRAYDFPTGKVASAAVQAASGISNGAFLDGWQHSGGRATHSWWRLPWDGGGSSGSMMEYGCRLDWSSVFLDVAGFHF